MGKLKKPCLRNKKGHFKKNVKKIFLLKEAFSNFVSASYKKCVFSVLHPIDIVLFASPPPLVVWDKSFLYPEKSFVD